MGRVCSGKHGHLPCDDAAGYRRLFGAYDGNSLADSVTIGARRAHRDSHRATDPDEKSHRAAESQLSILDTQTKTWVIKVSIVQIRFVQLTENMVRAIADLARKSLCP